MNRRQFLAQAAAAMLPWQGPVLDIHAHLFYNGRTNEQLLAHCKALGIAKAVLLPAEGSMRPTPIAGNEACVALEREHPKLFVRFSSADVKTPGAIDRIRKFLKNGGIGIGEQKYPVAADGPEMRAVFELASEFRVPVLMHFEEGTSLNVNTGFRNLPRVFSRYPNVTFIGHAVTWWVNISADTSGGSYPKGPIKPGGLTDRLLSDYPNVYTDLSAGSGLNVLTRDPEFARDFVRRQKSKLIFGSDCTCRDGSGEGTKNHRCIARDCLTALQDLTGGGAMFRSIVWDNGTKLLRLV